VTAAVTQLNPCLRAWREVTTERGYLGRQGVSPSDCVDELGSEPGACVQV